MFFDTHAHLDDARYDEDREAVIASMKEEGISPCMTVGANMRMNRMAVQLAPEVVMSATVVMPLDSDSRPPRMAESYQSATSIFADSSRMVMIQVA